MSAVNDGCFHRSRLEKAKKEQEDRLEYVKEQLEICTHDAKRRIKEITAKVEGQVRCYASGCKGLFTLGIFGVIFVALSNAIFVAPEFVMKIACVN